MTAVRENWFLLVDPVWVRENAGEVPPIRSVLGGWLLDDGRPVRFLGNPGYVPGRPDSPSDLVDAALALLLDGRLDARQFQLLLRESTCEIALNAYGRPLVAWSPDEVPCVVAATSAVHRRTRAAGWLPVGFEELVEHLGDLDVLVNPGGVRSVRLVGEFVRAAGLLDDREAAEVCATLRDSGLGVLTETLPIAEAGPSS
ncbi:type VII secretion system-associated protein [Lentzea aerocolonigenes]|uniref:type VII secretion system-associated protein n=1 Tax=Lentzea aerocolonigenes TaxID=68170 RepID=UPI0005EC4AFF|nr:type VII secretion system-associated protein [Lentzea aerocolonigenes]